MVNFWAITSLWTRLMYDENKDKKSQSTQSTQSTSSNAWQPYPIW